MKNKIISILTICLMMCTLVGCSSSSTSKTSTEETTESKSIGTILIDPGHGSVSNGVVDNGATDSTGEYVEGEINLKAAKMLGKYLEKNNVEVYYTRDGDSELENESYTYEGVTYDNDLRSRAELGETLGADYFVSLHCDSAAGKVQRNGYHIYYHKKYKDSKDLAKDISSALKKAGYKPQSDELAIQDGSDYRVIRLNTTISCLIEMGFLSGDIDYLTDDTKLEKFVQAIGDGIITKLKAGKLEPDVVLEKQPNL